MHTEEIVSFLDKVTADLKDAKASFAEIENKLNLLIEQSSATYEQTELSDIEKDKKDLEYIAEYKKILKEYAADDIKNKKYHDFNISLAILMDIFDANADLAPALIERKNNLVTESGQLFDKAADYYNTYNFATYPLKLDKEEKFNAMINSLDNPLIRIFHLVPINTSWLSYADNNKRFSAGFETYLKKLDKAITQLIKTYSERCYFKITLHHINPEYKGSNLSTLAELYLKNYENTISQVEKILLSCEAFITAYQPSTEPNLILNSKNVLINKRQEARTKLYEKFDETVKAFPERPDFAPSPKEAIHVLEEKNFITMNPTINKAK